MDNAQRSEVAYRAVLVYQNQHGGDPDTLTAIQDMITNLLHCAVDYGMDTPEDLCRKAVNNFKSEVHEEINPLDEYEPQEPDRDGWNVGDRAGAFDFGDRGDIVAFDPTDFDSDGFAFAYVKLDFGTTDGQPVRVSVQDLTILTDE